MLIIFYSCTIYTIYVTVLKDGTYTIVLQAACFVSAGVQSNVKLICFITQRFRVREAQTFLDDTYKGYENRGGNYRKVLLASIAATMKGIKAFAFIYVLVVLACSGFPIVYNALYDERILVMQFLLPGVDPSTTAGFALLSALHVFCLCLGAFGNFASDMYFLTFIGSVPLLKNILRCKFQDLNEMLDRESQPTSKQVRDAMMDIVIWHKEYLRLLFCTSRIFFIIIFAHIFCSAVSVVTTVYCMLIGVWPAAPFFMVLSLANLYLYCGLGTVVDNSNDDCACIIYTSCWYKLPITEQRVVLLMLLKCQGTESLTVGSMLPLTVATALSITKTVYSMLMLLMRGRD
ncbi:odorant receptor 67d [Drosophila innubila]|uniref:odorant receptor 67d n=1 Tax=Drosophila innubila TaxID=198719 RepID=UPI00148CCD50|nr:odorant receptor 67d [Drosophila innubila]